MLVRGVAVSADDHLARRVGEALARRVDGATGVDVRTSEWRGEWTAAARASGPGVEAS